MKELELASLLCSRVCHDLISPVGALANGLEVLSDEADEELKGHAMALIGSSAAQASAKLQFARLAFGAASSQGAEIDLADAEYVARELFKSLKVELDWHLGPAMAPKDEVKLILNLILVATETVPRGGRIAVTRGPGGLAVTATGKGARLNPQVREALLAEAATPDLDPRTVQPFVAGLLARALGRRIGIAEAEGAMTFTVAAPPA